MRSLWDSKLGFRKKVPVQIHFGSVLPGALKQKEILLATTISAAKSAKKGDPICLIYQPKLLYSFSLNTTKKIAPHSAIYDRNVRRLSIFTFSVISTLFLRFFFSFPKHLKQQQAIEKGPERSF